MPNPSNTTKATRTSRCPWCDDLIHDGDEIAFLDGSWVHAECWPEASEELGGIE
jgi:hypothetical protein